MRNVIGIDAAWTASNSSGVALLCEDEHGWRCAKVASNYRAFVDAPTGIEGPIGTLNVRELLDYASKMCNSSRPRVVAVDMPLAHTPITRRRVADNQISTAFGTAWCSTHSPSATRPGKISDRMREDFANHGYPLTTTASAATALSTQLIEVYPHPALVRLCNTEKRLPYKVSKRHKYWPGDSAQQRIANIVRELTRIANALRATGIRDIPSRLLEPATTSQPKALKKLEDELDAIVCAWIGVCFLDGRVEAFGDTNAAIWVPTLEA